MPRKNELGQMIGDPVPGWSERPRPPRTPLEGRLTRLEPLRASAHAKDLHTAFSADADARHWTYLPYGPFASVSDYAAWCAGMETRDDPHFFTILEHKTGAPIGVASYLRIDPVMGCIEVGHLRFSSALQRTPASTEAMYLMMKRAFDELGYRRYEWKCDSLNAPSVAAAKRLGFQWEGIFRQAVVHKGRNRDTAWLSITGGEWPRVKAALESWLDPGNFNDAGQQKARLEELRAMQR